MSIRSLGLWRTTLCQSITSAETSVRNVPRALKQVAFNPGTVNVDIGGGRFDDATAFLSAMGVENLVFDPFNRTIEHNAEVARRVCGGGADTATVLNVLNVIADPWARSRVIALAADAVGRDGHAWFQVYRGDRSGIGRRTTKGWQENRALSTYRGEISCHFDEIIMAKGVIRAAQPKLTRHRTAVRSPIRRFRTEWAQAA